MHGQDGAGVRALGVEVLVTLFVPLAIHHHGVPARCRSQCHEVGTQHDSELVLARQPERLTRFDDVQRPLGRPVELQDSTHGGVVDLDDHVAHDEEDVVEVTVRDHEPVAVPRDPGNSGVLELSGEVKTDHGSSVPAEPGPWQWVTTWLVIGLVLVFGFSLLIGRLTNESADSQLDLADARMFQVVESSSATALLTAFTRRFARLAITLTPVYIVVVFVQGWFRSWAFPLTGETTLVLALAVAIVLGTLIDLSTAGEVPVILALSAAGPGHRRHRSPPAHAPRHQLRDDGSDLAQSRHAHHGPRGVRRSRAGLLGAATLTALAV